MNHTPQTAIIPDHCTAGIFIEADIVRPQAVQTAVRTALNALKRLQNQFPDNRLGMSIGFGADFWHSLNRPAEGAELKNFTPLGNGLAPATQHDLLIHIQSLNHDNNYTLAQAVLDAFGDALVVRSEEHGFRRHQERGLDGFIDGTENPQETDDIRTVGVIGGDAPDAGGSYAVVQKYRHDLHQWNGFDLAQQEEAVGRSKADDIEFEGEQLHPEAHIARVNLKENGVGLKIVRRSLPFGKVSGEHGLMFIAYCARLHNIEQQLLSMFGDSADQRTDLLLHRLTRAVSGAYYFVPSVERLHNLQNQSTSSTD
ncbi:Dyp-type peroxidase [Conchiformibius kuhniae]|uniref:Dyp-type peroxidase n=1 Tax=Conchiformibius kuhniae TaxID=211502 RepID=A0A8T9MXS5_9NEIS|nr:Dyp-type peroxidase [Conchiformibius kuhniae]UOP05226.1 Dyp-type peroxidase [Conchiformibius kuhniae]